MMLSTKSSFILPFLLAMSNNAHAVNSQNILPDLCMGTCELTNAGEKVCTFNFKVDLHASELGYFTVEGCDGIMPTLGMERGVTYIFDQGDESNYYHPLGLAYYAAGAHHGKDELEPVVSLSLLIYHNSIS